MGIKRSQGAKYGCEQVWIEPQGEKQVHQGLLWQLYFIFVFLSLPFTLFKLLIASLELYLSSLMISR